MRPLYEMIISKDTDKLNAVSLVKKPAIESDFIKLSKQVEIKLSYDDDKMEVTGAVLIPDQKIYRTDGKNEWDIFLTAETIKELSNNLLSSDAINRVTLDHNEVTEDVQLIESWIVADSNIDKSVALGLEPLKVGTLVHTRKFNNVELWKQVKAGDYNGYSIEALLTPKLVEMSAQDKVLNEIKDIIGNSTQSELQEIINILSK